MPELLGYRLCQTWKQLVAVLVVEPQTASSVPTVMESMRAGGKPHLLHLRLPRQDKLRAARELNRHDTVGRRVIHLVRVEVLEPFRDFAQGDIGSLAKFVIVHAPDCINHRPDAATVSPLTLLTGHQAASFLNTKGEGWPLAKEVGNPGGFRIRLSVPV